MNSQYFETIKAIDGTVYNIGYHQRRYESVLEYFHIKEVYNLFELLKPPENGLFRCKVVYDITNPHAIDVSYYEYNKRDVQTLKLVYCNDIDYKFKAQNREKINELFAKKEQCDDILIVKNSLITDTSIANIAFFNGTKWLTPKVPLLQGTVRARLLDEGRIFEDDIFEDDIYRFENFALLNSMIDFDIISPTNIRKSIC